MGRVFAYIDGFNLYFGLRQSRWKDLYWLNLQALVLNLLKPGQQLMRTKYFTAQVNEPAEKRLRQQTFLETLQTLPDFSIYYGNYLLAGRRCPSCHHRYQVPTEKMTDVSIAVEMLTDAIQDSFDTALLISADSDLRPPIEKVRLLCPNKRIVLAFPPNRHSLALSGVAHAYFSIGRAKLKRSVFPKVVIRADGYELHCPKEWS